MRDHVTIIVQFHHAAHQIRGGHISCEHEHAERATVSRFPRFGLAGGPVQDRSFTQTALTGSDALQLDLVTHVDFWIVFGCGGHRGVASKILFPHENGDFGGVCGQEHGFLGCCEPSSDHQYFLAGEEFAIAGSTVGHTAASVFGFPFEP